MRIDGSISDSEKYADIARRLEESEKTIDALLNAAYNLSIIMDPDGIVLKTSKALAAKYESSEGGLMGQSLWQIMPEEFSRIRKEFVQNALKFRTPVHFEGQSEGRWYDYIICPIFDARGTPIKIAVLCRDISVRKKAMQSLEAARQRLEQKSRALAEKNIALREIIKLIDNEKDEIYRSIQVNIDRSITPLLRKLENHLTEQARNYIEILKDNLNDITSPFLKKLEDLQSRLTPREIEVCSLVKEGLTSKEIAQNLNVSPETVKNQRKNIRKKLRISKDNVNLSIFLQDF